MPDDPLARFRREPRPVSKDDQEHEALTEHQALGLAIRALSQIPDHAPLLQYELREAYETGQKRTRLAELAPQMYDTLLLCEDALTELGRMDDGTPSIQALINIQIIKKEADYPLPGPDLRQTPEKASDGEKKAQDRDIEPER